MKKGLLFLSLGLIFVLAGCGANDQNQNKDALKGTLSPQKAKAEAQQFINNNILDNSKQKAKVTSIEEEKGVYKLSVDVSGHKIDSYMTKDGEKFFPESMDTQKQNSQTQKQNSQKRQSTVSKKAETPHIELFVMSYCPYGTQMEKTFLPVVKTLGDKIDFDLKFCDYSMHGKKEVDENMRQYCIKQEQPNKLIDYLDCFLESKDSKKCMQETGINQSTIKSCVSRVDKKYKVTKKYNDKSTWKGGRYPVFPVYAQANKKYGVQGSPTVVINGQKIKVQRNPNALLDTVCSAFKKKPQECEKELSTSSPSSGFGSSSGSGGSSGSCG